MSDGSDSEAESPRADADRGSPEDDQFGHPKGLGRIALGGCFLGFVAGFHFLLLLYSVLAADGSALQTQWSVYILALAFFHVSEFVVTAKYKPRQTSFASFLLDDGKAYRIAVALSWVEYGLELYFVPWLKDFALIMCLGIAITVMGQYFRAAAMWTAKASFSHTIVESREESHVLVTHGVYRWLRHPSYFGWYWWAIGTQVVLCNPVCVVVYAVVATYFFKRRVPYEEWHLMRLFPDYDRYMQSTPIGIPGVRGADDLLRPSSARPAPAPLRRQQTAGARLQHS